MSPPAKATALTVVVCSHGRPDDLARCLEALERLEHAVDVVVVDSASSPPLVPVVEQFPRCRYVYENRPGLSRARNRGLAETHTELVAFVDDDAQVQADWAGKIVDALRHGDRIGCVGGACLPDFAAPRPDWLSDRLLAFAGVRELAGEAREARSSADWPFGANMAFRADALKSVGGFPEELGRDGRTLISGEDGAVAAALLRAGWKIWLEPAAAVHHRVSPERLERRYYWRRIWWEGRTHARMSPGGRRAAGLAIETPRYLLRYLATHDLFDLLRATAEPLGHVAEWLSERPRRPTTASVPTVETPRVTAVIPVWDRYCAYLSDCVQSILDQDEPVRAVVVDNGSEEPLPELPPEVEIVRTGRRLSVGAARNLGLEHVETPYVAFVDADDRVLPGTFAFCAGELDARLGDVGCSTSLLAWKADTGAIRPSGRPREHAFRLSRRRLPLALYLLGRCAFFLETGTVLRTEAVRDAGGFGQGDYAEDWQLAAALAFRGPIGLHRRPGGLYRIHSRSLYGSARGHALYADSMRVLRTRIRRNRCVPRAVKLLLPALGFLHALKARSLTRAEANGDPRRLPRALSRTGSATAAVVPVWDAYCSLLPGCIQSLLDQDERPRVIVVDNASRVPLPELPPEVEVVRLPKRLSVGEARNAGLERVSSRYVLFCDADDRMLPGAIGFLRSRLDSRPELVSAIRRFVSWNPSSGKERLIDRMPRPIVFHISRRPRLFALANLRYNCFLLVGCLHRTAAVRDAGGFADANLGEDWVLGTQLAFRGPLEFNRAPLFRHRVEAGTLWQRSHSREALVERCARLRTRLRSDHAVPLWVKAALPLLALVHAYDVRRSTPGGYARPRDDFSPAPRTEAAA